MNSKEISKMRIISINILIIMFSAAFAIVVHAILPAAVDVEQFDSILVSIFGFPIVAISYFLILYTQCSFSVRYFGERSKLTNLQTGIRFGIAFALIYLFAMQEVIVESSPFSKYGFEFIKYELFMGLGDAIPVFILCIVVALFTIKTNIKTGNVQKMKKLESLSAISIITIAFFVERTIGYKTGIVHSSCDKYTVPCYIWTLLFGIILGYVYQILYPVLFNEKKWINIPIGLFLTIGLNWIIFNSFIGMIMKGAILEMLLKSGLDILTLFVCSIIIGRFIIKNDNSSPCQHSAF